MSIGEDDRPKKKIFAQPGEVLDELSVHELRERIELYRAEIVRLEQEIGRKQTSRSAAESIFRRPDEKP